MDLALNPFFLLGASVRDNTQRLIELADERSLTVDPKKCNEARASLTNPRLRLTAEIAWLPGVSPSRAWVLLEQAGTGSALSIPILEGMYPLAACNLLIYSLAAFKVAHGLDSTISESIKNVITKFEEVDLEDVVRLINEDRAVAGFPTILGEDAIRQALFDHKSFLVSTLRESLNNAKEPDAVLTDITVYLTHNGVNQAPILLEELTARYQIEVTESLDCIAEEIFRLKEASVQYLASNQGTGRLPELLGQIEKLLHEWDRIAQPIQLVEKTRGLEDKFSARLAKEIRSLSIYLNNTFGLHDEALRLCRVMEKLFAELPQFAAVVEEDITAINKIVQEENKALTKAREEREKWEREIFLNLPIGSDRLIINGDTITYQGYSLRTNEVNRVRWGIYKHYTNGIRTSRNFTIWVRSPEGLIEIECVRFMESEATVTQRYELILEKLWKAVCVRLIGQTISRLSEGEKLRFGKAVVDKDGILLPKYKFLGMSSDPVHYPWEELSFDSGGGNFRISVSNVKNAYAQLPYREVDNLPILEAILRYLWKDGNYLKLKRGELH